MSLPHIQYIISAGVNNFLIFLVFYKIDANAFQCSSGIGVPFVHRLNGVSAFVTFPPVEYRKTGAISFKSVTNNGRPTVSGQRKKKARKKARNKIASGSLSFSHGD